MGKAGVASWPVGVGGGKDWVVFTAETGFGEGYSSDNVGVLHIDDVPVGLAPGRFEVDDDIEVHTDGIGVVLSGVLGISCRAVVAGPSLTVVPDLALVVRGELEFEVSYCIGPSESTGWFIPVVTGRVPVHTLAHAVGGTSNVSIRDAVGVHHTFSWVGNSETV